MQEKWAEKLVDRGQRVSASIRELSRAIAVSPAT